MAENTWAMISDRITANSDLNTRMEETAKLLYWDDFPYKLTKPDGKTELTDAISVTPNIAKVFVHGVVSDLLGGKWQAVVDGDVSSVRAHDIENFGSDAFAQADEWLQAEQDIPSLDSWLCNHVCVRYAIGARIISWVVKGEYHIEIYPVDMRWTPYVKNKWVAPILKLKQAALEEYLERYERRAKDDKIGKYFPISLSPSEAAIEVRDFWGIQKHEVWVDSKLVYTEKTDYETPPFVIVIPARGFMLRDEGYLKHEGEDILFLIKGLCTEFARSLSLEQTAGYAGVYPSFQRPVKNLTGEPSLAPPNLGDSQDVKDGELFQLVPRGDFNKAAMTARADIKEGINLGAPTSPPDYNTPQSAIAMAGEQELIGRLQNAGKDALGIWKSQAFKVIERQFIAATKGKAEVRVGKQGKMSKYSAATLGNPDNYTVTYHLSVKSKRQELANLQEFVAVYDKLPLEWTLPEILMADDPAGIIKDLGMRKAKQANPALEFLEMGLDFLTEADKISKNEKASVEDKIMEEVKREQAKIMAHEYVMAMRARTQPALPAPAPRLEAPKGNIQALNAAAGALRGEAVPPRPTEEAG